MARAPSSTTKISTAGGIAVTAATTGWTGLASSGAMAVAALAFLATVTSVVVHRQEWYAWLRQTRQEGKLLVLIGMILCAFGFVGFFAAWIKGSPVPAQEPSTGSAATNGNNPGEPRPANIGMQGFMPMVDYVPDSDVSGIKWKVGYAHVRITIVNPSFNTYSNFNMLLAPEFSIIEARAKSDLADCRIANLAQEQPMLQTAVWPDGRRTSTETMPIQSIALGPPYRLYCAALPGSARVVVDLAVVKQRGEKALQGGPLWEQERHDPAYVDTETTYEINGIPYREISSVVFDQDLIAKMHAGPPAASNPLLGEREKGRLSGHP